MEELITQIESVLAKLRASDWLKEKQELELNLMKAERGNETLQERIKEKDNIIDDYKDFVLVLRGRKDEKKTQPNPQSNQ